MPKADDAEEPQGLPGKRHDQKDQICVLQREEILAIELRAWTHVFPWITDLEGFLPVIIKGALQQAALAWAACLGQDSPAYTQEVELQQACDDSKGGKGCADER